MPRSQFEYEIAGCPNDCITRHKFSLNRSGVFDAVVILNHSSSPKLIVSLSGTIVKIVQEPNVDDSMFHRFVTKHPRYLSKIRGHAGCSTPKAWDPRLEIGHLFLPSQVRRGAPLANKSELLSVIASTLAILPGHHLRNFLIEDLLVAHPGLQKHTFGRGRREIASKELGLDPYMFSLAIENSIIDGYNTEKLFDCIHRGVIPVYIGGKLPNPVIEKAIVRVNAPFKENLVQVTNLLSRELYESLGPQLQRAQMELEASGRLCCFISKEHMESSGRARVAMPGLELHALIQFLRTSLYRLLFRRPSQAVEN